MPRPFTTNTGKHRATLAVVKILVVKSCYFNQCAITRMPWLSTRWCQAKMSVPNRQLMNQDHSESNYYFFVLFVFVLFIYWALKKLKKKDKQKQSNEKYEDGKVFGTKTMKRQKENGGRKRDAKRWKMRDTRERQQPFIRFVLLSSFLKRNAGHYQHMGKNEHVTLLQRSSTIPVTKHF